MLNNNYFYFSTVRKYVSLFGAIFNNLIINRNDANGNITQIINVPIEYAQKEKMLVRLVADPNIDKQAAVILPRMSFFLDGYTYDNTRRLPAANKFSMNLSNTAVQTQFTPTPWDFHFSLYIYVKYVEDAMKLIEQIIPFFGPQYTVQAIMIPGQQATDLPVILKDVSHEYTDTTDFKDRQTLIWTLRFSLKGFMYCPIITGSIINTANIGFFDWNGIAPVPNTDLYGVDDLENPYMANTVNPDIFISNPENFINGINVNG